MGSICARFERDDPHDAPSVPGACELPEKQGITRDAPGGIPLPPVPYLQSDLEELLPSDASGGNERYGFAVAQGPRKSMEDAVDVIARFDDSPMTELFALYDGHSGTAAVEFVKRHLPSMIQSQARYTDPDSSKFHEALQDAFAALDTHLCAHLSSTSGPEAPADENGSYVLSSGCVGTVVLVRGAALHVANLGDCRAIVCEAGVARELTEDHRADVDGNAAERERLKAIGVEVSNDGYLHGRISVSRAFGDWAFAAGEKCRGLISRPDISEFPLTADTEFLAMGSDGIFEKMTSKEACQIVRRKLRATGDARAAAEDLVQSALKRTGSDNLSALVVLFKRPPHPDGERAAPKLMLRRRVKLEDAAAPPDPVPLEPEKSVDPDKRESGSQSKASDA